MWVVEIQRHPGSGLDADAGSQRSALQRGGACCTFSLSSTPGHTHGDGWFVNELFVSEYFVHKYFVKELFVNKTFLNELFVNKSFVNETLVNESFVNETFVNETFLNKSFVNV